jgi:uncharacterized RDD family membrane protein YckC
MHSDEPIEDRFVTAPPQQVIADALWRAELAYRVCSYRARRGRSSDEENSPSLDFGSVSETQGIGPGTDATPNPTASLRAETQTLALPARNAFDTNYYRRLNAEAMAQGTAMNMGVSIAATAPAHDYDAGLPEENEENDVEVHAASADAPVGEQGNNPLLDLELRPPVAADSSLDRYRISAPEPEPQPPALSAPGNLILFRRPLLEPPLAPQPSRDELAEPMNNRPRILEVPEDIIPAMQGSLFPEIHLDGDEQDAVSNREPEIGIPLQVAPVSERLIAAMTDLGVVFAASLLFAGIAFRALPGIPHAKPFWMALAAVTMILWAVYQHLFLLFAGRTIGMSLRGIRLRTFDGCAPQWKQRRRRVRFMFISFAAVALGFLWALVDEDALCWHDRISRTFPTSG